MSDNPPPYPPDAVFFSPRPKPPMAPICESPVGKRWLFFKTNPRHPFVVGSGFVVRLALFGRYQKELRAWDKAGCPHVCGR